MIIRYLSSQVADAGKITGRVYTISSVSGMMVLPLMGFLLIPTFGITWPSIIIGILAGTVPFVMLISSRKYFTIFFIIAILVSVRSVNPVRSSEDVQVQYLSEGLLGQVMVADINTREWGTGLPPEYDRVMYVNRMGQTYIDLATGESVWEYVPYTIRILAALPAGSEALILGLGGGIVANALADELNFKVDAVELDERIVKIARHYFNLHPSIRVIVDDARHYLETTGKKYDVMVFDVYNGDVIPSHVMSLECFERVKEMLNDRGMIVVNFNGFLQGDTGLPGRSVYRTLTTAGFTTRVLLTPGSGNSRNALFIASLQSSDKDAVQVTAPGAHAGIPDSLFADRQLLTTGEALVLTDDKPLLEKRNFMAASQWRKSYHVYTELFLRQGIPLFE
jgi:predicted membrane-bound spermidine synthase